MNIKITSSYLIDSLLLSFSVSMLILFVAFGLMYIFENKESPISIPLLLLLIATSFIVGSAYFDKKGAHSIYSLIGGAIVSASATFIITSVIGGIRYLLTNLSTGSIPPLESIISVIALLMIASLVILRIIIYQVKISSSYYK
ncbi:MAG: hypothetical protein QXJ68_05950 [Methanocellales archaeon]